MSKQSPSPEENLVDEFSNLIRKYIDTPKEFADAVGFGLSSALLGPFFKSLWVPHGTPNLFIILSSLPGRTRRSTVQDAFERVYTKVHKTEKMEKAIEDFVSEELKKEENKNRTAEQIRDNISDEDCQKIEDKVDDEVQNLIIEEGSSEGVIDHIEGTNSNEFIITSREMGEVFRKIFKEDGYQSGVGLLWSRLYYGEGCTVYLSSRGGKKGGRKIRKNLYVTMLGGMQEFRLYITEDAVRQGLARRIIIVYVPKAKEWKPPISEERENFHTELDDFADKIIERRKYLCEALEVNRGTLDIIVHPEVERKINEFDHEWALKLDSSPTLENIAKQSEWEHLFKLAACYEIAKMKEVRGSESEKIEYHVLIAHDSYDKAKAFLDLVNENSKGEIDVISDIPAKTVNVKIPEERLYGIIADSGKAGISKTKLEQRTGWKSDEVGDLVIRLIRQGRIKCEVDKTATKPKNIFTAIPCEPMEE